MGKIIKPLSQLPPREPKIKNLTSDYDQEFYLTFNKVVTEIVIDNRGASSITLYLNDDLDEGKTIDSGVTYILDNIAVERVKITGITNVELMLFLLDANNEVYKP